MHSLATPMPPNLPDLNPVDYNILQDKVYKLRITDLNELKQRLRTEWAKPDHVIVAVIYFVIGVVNISRSVMRVLYTVCCNISHNAGVFGGHNAEAVQKFFYKIAQNGCISIYHQY